jgi:hypothetical protein
MDGHYRKAPVARRERRAITHIGVVPDLSGTESHLVGLPKKQRRVKRKSAGQEGIGPEG